MVQVLIRAGEFFEDSQGVFVESAHGDGDAQATGEARGFVDRAQRAGVCAGASVLSAAERVAGGGGLRRVRREPLREVLCGPVRSSVADAWDLLPVAADRILRGHRGSERGIAWRLADSLALRRFLGIGLDEYTPDHSTISRTRRLIDLDTHREVFG